MMQFRTLSKLLVPQMQLQLTKLRGGKLALQNIKSSQQRKKLSKTKSSESKWNCSFPRNLGNKSVQLGLEKHREELYPSKSMNQIFSRQLFQQSQVLMPLIQVLTFQFMKIIETKTKRPKRITNTRDLETLQTLTVFRTLDSRHLIFRKNSKLEEAI